MVRPRTAVLALMLGAARYASAYEMVPRWGHATVFIPSPHSLLIQGGKTSSPEHTYSSSPNSPDLIRLPLTSGFNTSTPPYELVSTSPSPAYAWHTLSYLNSTGQALVFGGDGGPATPLPAGTDSAWLLSLGAEGQGPPTFTQQTPTWANQPQRRILHSTATALDGTTYITGGQRNDGSGLILSDAYTFNPATSTFSPLPGLPRGTAHHISALLPNGTLLVVGGIHSSQETGNPALGPMSSLYTLDTKSATPGWQEVPVSGTGPSSRRGAAGVLIGDDRLYMIGGTGMSSAEAMSDVWALDIKAGVWSQLNPAGNAPPARFDPTAVNVGGGQILVFGGYSNGGAVAPDTFIFDTTSNAWTSSFSAVTASSAESPPGTGSSSSSVSGPIASSSSGAGASSGSSQVGTGAPVSNVTGPSATASEPSASSTESSAMQNTAPALNKGAQIGLAIGVTMALSAMAAMVVILVRRRRAGMTGAESGEKNGPSGWFGPRPPPLDTDDRALLATPTDWSEKGGIIGLGFGAVGAGISALQGSKRNRAYRQLDDEKDSGEQYRAAPARKSTRRAGEGIRLIGPRSNPSAVAAATAPTPISPPRVNMLHDEDSRSFGLLHPPQAETKDWTVERKNRDQWRTADSVLGHEQETTDPFEDALPLIRGGPVPTPHARSEVDPFEDQQEADIASIASRGRGPGLYQLAPLASSEPLDIAGLLAPSAAYHDASLPRSSHSRGSTQYTSSDAEEGTIHHAHVASHSHSYSQVLYSSPSQDEEYVPIKRNESFFRRMASGGISSLMGGSTKRASVRRSESFDIRDPAPVPSLWPVQSRHDLEGPAEDGTGLLVSPIKAHTKGPSVSSLTSARSMRDMVIVRREGTEGSEGSLVLIERTDSVRSTPDMTALEAEHVLDGLSPVLRQNLANTSVSSAGTQSLATGYGGGSDTRPFFASPTEGLSPVLPLPLSALPGVSPARTTNAAPPVLQIITESPASTHTQSSTRSAIPHPPSGSPLPKHLVEHRRPVKDMVTSINKRASRTFPDTTTPLSPTSMYSATPGATPLLVREAGESKGISYEVRRKDSLVVANPDKRGGR